MRSQRKFIKIFLNAGICLERRIGFKRKGCTGLCKWSLRLPMQAEGGRFAFPVDSPKGLKGTLFRWLFSEGHTRVIVTLCWWCNKTVECTAGKTRKFPVELKTPTESKQLHGFSVDSSDLKSTIYRPEYTWNVRVLGLKRFWSDHLSN